MCTLPHQERGATCSKLTNTNSGENSVELNNQNMGKCYKPEVTIS